MGEPRLLPIVETPVACSLAASDLDTRLSDWRRLLADVRRRESDGVSAVVLHFDGDAPVADLAALCTAEVGCCPFFTFELTIATKVRQLRIAVPPGAEPMLHELSGLLPEV